MQPLVPAKTPRILWVELTSKCPFDCVFCSRQTRRGSGEHMPYRLFKSLVSQVEDPRTFLLNYSGESTVYPDLIPAVRLARSTGASVELVSALACASEPLLFDLSRSGLSRLTVSLHAADAHSYREIYRYSSLDVLRDSLMRFAEFCWEVDDPPIVDVAFVAMERNLGELAAVAGLAAAAGVRSITIFPVIRRDEIPVQFPRELTAAGDPRDAFRAKLNQAVETARAAQPKMGFTVANPVFTSESGPLGSVPAPCPGELPASARIHSCEQNPWETAHVLSNGDVVACEVHDREPLGNLARQPLAAIWHGDAYREFRAQYHAGSIEGCRRCPWKRAYVPTPFESEIVASRGRSAQLLHGWHEPSDEPHIWASQQALALVQPRPASTTLHVSGVLPPGPNGQANELTVSCNGAIIGAIVNSNREPMAIGVDLPVAAIRAEPWSIQLRTRHVFWPKSPEAGADQRDLGFALVLLASKAPVHVPSVRRNRHALERLRRAIHAIDACGCALRRCRRFPKAARTAQRAPGVSVLIPERDTPDELASCLAGVRAAAVAWWEPVQIIVVVNGSPPSSYRALRSLHPEVRWQFHPAALGFAGAIAAGLPQVRNDWVYLLNSDAVPEPDALAAACGLRDAATFSIASQILLRDRTRFREETNWTTLFLENGLATIHDLIPRSSDPVEHFYAGGGASLFQTRLLRSLLDARVYHPFYWEDVEWGWRARKLGYRSIFCPASRVEHVQRATIARHYPPEQVEAIVERNRLLFHLRNLTASGSLDAVVDAIANGPRELTDFFLQWTVLAQIGCGRLWNHLAPVPDDAILDLSPAAGTDRPFPPGSLTSAAERTVGACD
jgi:GT2 family glycosyltransferase/MoaA/NifB/PqqE/SkfB family radical SAM enzyme